MAINFLTYLMEYSLYSISNWNHVTIGLYG